MLIEHWVRPFIAVLGLAAVVPLSACNADFYNSPTKHSNRENWKDKVDYYNYSLPIPTAGKLLTHRENQMLLRAESRDHHVGADCCPSVLEMIEPLGGSNQEGNLVKLYRSETHRQRFYEVSCHADVVDKPCRFVDRKLHEQSRCVQKYSYTYALVHEGNASSRLDNIIPIPYGGAGGTYTLDYIKVRSGCACVVTPKNNSKKRKRGKHRKNGEN